MLRQSDEGDRYSLRCDGEGKETDVRGAQIAVLCGGAGSLGATGVFAERRLSFFGLVRFISFVDGARMTVW